MSDTKKEYPIVWWTKWFNKYRYEGMMTDDCGLPYNCRHTLDRSKYNEAKVIVFHESDWNPKDLPPLQDVHDSKKSWVLNSLERPKPESDRYISLFTYQFTYHFESDFIMAYFTSGRSSTRALINLVSRPPLHTLEEKNQFRKHGFHEQDSRALAPVAWIVSNCRARNGRHFMVNQLKKYIDVDIYGNCMPNRKWPKRKDGVTEMAAEELASHYKFYLAIENSNCDDYVTEKLERALAVGAVPVVDGPKDYSRFTPGEKSIIQYNDYGSPELLARHLKVLDNDDNSYQEYLTFRANRTADNTDKNGQVNIDSPATFNQDYKERLLPWFVDNWDIDTTGSPNKSTTQWLSEDGSERSSRAKYGMQWGPDEQGARCALCRVARDLTEGDAVIDPSRRLPTDTACTFRKFHHASWIIAFYPYWTLLALVAMSVLLFVLLTQTGRGYAKGLILKVLKALKALKIATHRKKQHDYFELQQESGSWRE
ncbi:Alpha 1,3 fucosyltransferase [Mortierella polycephala]|uniref:Fucosyltransferase n=1 Tax=Mortierella polycephala TaxID=41804 RepID=A0A9P6PLH3_9FUNG|nr:Alpha 1,3 fucosyltransferase [Mortierella polycephala]